MRIVLFLLSLLVLSNAANAAPCPTAPASGADDTIIRFVKPTGGYAGALSASTVSDKTLEGTLIYDTTNKTLRLCDGTNWLPLSTKVAGAIGEIQYNDGTSNLAASPALQWNNTSKSLIIGTATEPGSLNIQGYAGNLAWGAGSGAVMQFTRPEANYFQASSVGGYFIFVTSAAHPSRAGASLIIEPNKNLLMPAGSLGIGTSPTYKLHIVGDAAATAFLHTSDARLKNNIQPIPYGLKTILKLNPVSYNWKVDADNRKIGLLAQEVEALIPEAVSTANDANGTKSIAYSDIIPVLIQAIQEMQVEIDMLKKQQTVNAQSSSSFNQ